MNAFFKKAGTAIVNHLPAIMTSVSIALDGWAIALAVAATPRAEIHIYEKKQELGVEKLTIKQTIEACGKDYIPAATAFFAGSSLAIGSLGVVNRRLATLSASYQIKEALNGEYREKVKELLGPEKEAEVAKDAQKSYVENYDAGIEHVPSRSPEDLFCLNGRYFWSTRDKNTAAINRLNNRLNSNEDISLNDIYEEFGLAKDPAPLHGKSYSDYHGFASENDKSGRPDQIEIGYDPGTTKDGKSCQVVFFVVGPHKLRDYGGYYD